MQDSAPFISKKNLNQLLSYKNLRDIATPYSQDIPAESIAGDMQTRQRYIDYIQSPEYIQDKASEYGEAFSRILGVESPYEIKEERLKLKQGLQELPEVDIAGLSEEEANTKQVMRNVYNDIVTGRTARKGFFDNAFRKHSMTGSILNFIGGMSSNYLDVSGFKIEEDGAKYKGKTLKLEGAESEILMDYVGRMSDTDREKSTFEQFGEVFVGLSFDLPLLALTGGIASGAMKATQLTSALARAGTFWGRMTGQVIQQGINFNLLGVPGVINASLNDGLSGFSNEVWHNLQMGALASATGTIGTQLYKPVSATSKALAAKIAENPVMYRELGGLAGSFGFGYTSTKLGGAEDMEAVATGLAFAATHFTNPKAYQAVLKSQMMKPVELMTIIDPSTGRQSFHPDYFIRENNNLRIINKAELQKGKLVVEEKVKPIEITDEIANNLVHYNTVEGFYYQTFREALAEGRRNKHGKQLYNRWTEELPKDYVKQHKDELRQLSEVVAASVVVGDVTKVFNRTYLPDNAELQNKMVDLANNWQLPYSEVKKYVVNNLPSYIIDPEGFRELHENNPLVVKDLSKMMDVIADTHINEAKRKYAKDFVQQLNKSQLLLPEGKGEPFNLDVEQVNREIQRRAESIKRVITAEELSKGTILPSDNVVYLDYKGELLPLEILKDNKARVSGTNIEIDYAAAKNKGKIKTGKEIKAAKEQQLKAEETKLEVNSEITYKLGEETIKATVTDVRAEGKEIVVRNTDGTQLVIVPTMVKEVKAGKPESKTEAQKVMEGEIATPELMARAQKILGESFNKELEQYLQRPENQGIIERYTDKEFAKGMLVEQFAKETVAGDLMKDSEAPKPLEPLKTQLEAPQETIIEKPIPSKGEVKKEALKRSKEEFFNERRRWQNIDTLIKENLRQFEGSEEQTVKALIADKVITPEQAKFYAESKESYSKPLASYVSKEINDIAKNVTNIVKAGKSISLADKTTKGRIINELTKLEEKSKDSADILSKEIGVTFKPDEIMVLALDPFYTAREIGSMLALKGYRGGDARKNEDFVSNTKKKFSIKKGKETEGVAIAETKQAGLEEVKKPKSKAEIETERAAAEKAVLEESMKVQDEISKLLKEGKTEADVKELRDKQRLLGKRYAELSADDKLFETATKELEVLKQSPEQRAVVEQEIKEVLPKVEIGWDATLPKGKAAATYVDAEGRLHIDFTNLASTKAPLHERIHGQALLAADQVTLNRVLKEIYPEYDGVRNSESWRAAHEELVKRAMTSQKDSYGVVDKVREVWEKLRNFFTGKGWYSTAEYYRRLLNNELTLKEVGEATKPLYEAEIDKLKKQTKQPSYTEEQRERFSNPMFPAMNEAQIAHMQFNRLANWELDRAAYGRQFIKGFFDSFKDNMWVAKAGGLFRKVYAAAIQTSNLAYQTNKRGEFVNKEFKGLYDIGDMMVNKSAEHFNLLYKNPEGWNEARNFRSIDAVGREVMTKKLKKYYDEVADGRKMIEQKEGEKLEDYVRRFGKEIGLNEKEIEAEMHAQRAYKQMYNHRRQIQQEVFETMRDNEGLYNITATLNENQIKKYFGDKFTEGKTDALIQREMKEIITADTELRKKIARELAVKMFPEYSGHYYNAVRPAEPSNFFVSGKKPSENMHHIERTWEDLRPGNKVFLDYKNIEYRVMKTSSEGVTLARTNERGLPGETFVLTKEEYNKRADKWDRYFTYAENKKDADKIAKEYFAEGYSVEEFKQIREMINTGDYRRLTAHQLQNLIEAGHIPRNDQTIQALHDAIKSGRFEQHTIKKEYIKGMHFTPLEYEAQVERFARESVAASTRRKYLNQMQDYLIEWDKQIEGKLKSPYSIHATEKEKIAWLRETGTKFYNQMAHSDASWVDSMRKLSTAYYLGIKPSFAFQQLFQNLQMGLPELVAESRNGMKHFTEAYNTATQLGWYLHGKTKGEAVKSNLPKELIDLYHTLDNRNLMAATGIRELMGEPGVGLGDAKYHYASGSYRYLGRMQKVANMAGAVAEKFTRLHTLSAVYSIGKEKGLSGDALVEYASRKMKDIQNVWGALGRPVWTQSKMMGIAEQKTLKAVAKSLYTFKTFMLGNLGQMDRLARNRQWGALGTKMTVALGLGGIRGLPFAATMFALADLFSEDDTEHELYKLLDELNQENGVRFGDMLNKGLFAQAGIDMSRMLGQGTSYATDLWAETRAKSAGGRIAEIMLGAPYGLTKDFLDAADGGYKLLRTEILNDDISTKDERKRALRNLQKITPVFLRNILSTMSLAKDGVEVRGKTIIKSDDLDWTDIVYKALSFNPLKIADAYEEQFSGTPAKLTRVKGRINELKRVRKEISLSADMHSVDKSIELRKVAELMREAQKKQAELITQLSKEKRKTYID